MVSNGALQDRAFGYSPEAFSRVGVFPRLRGVDTQLYQVLVSVTVPNVELPLKYFGTNNRNLPS